MNTRIKKLRDSLNLTLAAFGAKIGITMAAVSNIEKGRSNPSNQVVLAICREFRVSEEWLRTGQGEMFQQATRTQEIASFMNDVLAEAPDGPRNAIIYNLAQLDAEDWEAIAMLLRKRRQRQQQNEKTDL